MKTNTPIHFFTGGTGFLGSNLILELLNQSDAEIYCLVRPSSEDAEARLHRILMEAAGAYGYSKDILSDICERCHAVTGDITQENCGVALPFPVQVDQFWHCAASLLYEPRYKDEIFAANVTGTKHAVALAKLLQSSAFNFMSTAYVAGARTGVIPEAPAEPRENGNLYELSKIDAEAIVMGATGFQTRIFRFGLVVGHSKTLAAVNFSGVYDFLRKLTRFKAMLARIQEDFVQRETVCMQLDSEAPLDLFPVDYAARQAVQISLSDSPAQFFHLTNATPPRVGNVVRQTFREVGFNDPKFATSTEEFTWIDGKFGDSVKVFSSYLLDPKTFDRANADVALGGVGHGDYYYDTAGLSALYRWYLVRLAAEDAARQQQAV